MKMFMRWLHSSLLMNSYIISKNLFSHKRVSYPILFSENKLIHVISSLSIVLKNYNRYLSRYRAFKFCSKSFSSSPIKLTVHSNWDSAGFVTMWIFSGIVITFFTTNIPTFTYWKLSTFHYCFVNEPLEGE